MKRIRRIFTAVVLVAIFCINVNTLIADEYPIDVLIISKLPSIGNLQPCQIYHGGGRFEANVEWACYSSWVCIECFCIPEMCGNVSDSHF